MMRVIWIMVFAGFILTTDIQGQTDGFWLGIIAGEPTGFSAKKWMTPSKAVDGALAWSFIGDPAFHLHADYLGHANKWFDEFEGRLHFYYGLGGRFKLEGDGGGEKHKDGDDVRLGLRIPLGLTYLFADVPLDAFIEIVPVMDFFPETELGANAGIGVRYHLR